MSASEVAEQRGSDNTVVRAFQVGFPEAEVAELRRRVNATRWPERETVTDDSKGVPLAMMQELACVAWRTTRRHHGWSTRPAR
jgi:hypothetical protein